jgi:predicted ATPase
MAILEGIQIRNFRALKDVTLGRVLSNNRQTALPRLVAIIGANGTGKSSILDAISFLGDCLAEGVEAACDKPHRAGFDKLRTLGSDEPMQFEIRYRREGEPPINYTLHIDCDSNGHVYVAKEELKHKPIDRIGRGQPLTFISLKKGKGSAWTGGKKIPQNRESIEMANDQELAIDSVGALKNHPEIQRFREFMKRWYLSYFVPELARRTPVSGAQPHLDRTGENLANYLQYIERERKPQFKQMLKRLGKKIPGLERIEYEKTVESNLVLKFFAKGFEDKPFFQRAMSDGTLKLLAYLLLMEDPDPASLVGIEEPENGLHHQLLSALACELKEYAQQESGPQVLLTTHSPNLVDGLSPDEVWILEKNKIGFSTLTRAADIQGVQALYDEDIPMGSLWYSNHLSAVLP